MWEIFEILVTAFKSDETVNYLIKLYKKYAKYFKYFKKSGAGADIDIDIGVDVWSNPFAMKQLMKLMQPSEVNELKGMHRKYKENMAQMDKQEGSAKQKQQVSNQKEQEKTNEQYWIPVNSSWILQGKWTETNSRTKTGSLTLLIQPEKNPKIYGPYTYPSVPYEIWDLMCQAKGSHGSGAGTIFWRYWLRKWLPSQVRAYVKGHLKKELGIVMGHQGTRIPKFNSVRAIKVRNYIFKLEKGFVRTKFGQNNNEILTKRWRNQRTRNVRNEQIKAKRWEVYSMNKPKTVQKIKKGGKMKW